MVLCINEPAKRSYGDRTLVKSLIPKTREAGIDPAIPGLEIQRLIHYTPPPLPSNLVRTLDKREYLGIIFVNSA